MDSNQTPIIKTKIKEEAFKALTGIYVMNGMSEEEAKNKVESMRNKAEEPNEIEKFEKNINDLKEIVPMLNDEDIKIIVEKIRVIREKANCKYNLKHQYD